MKKISSWLALASLFVSLTVSAVSFHDIQFWTGTGTNCAGLVIEWSTPESFGNSTVPAPIADKTLVWGYRFNGTATGTQMLTAILAADPRLYVVVDETYGTYVDAIGYNLANGVALGITDGSHTNFFSTNNFMTATTVDVDAASALDPGDLYWGGVNGPNWETWNELGDAGGFFNCPDRGTNSFWTPDDPSSPWSGVQGQWELAQLGLDSLLLTNGSWLGFSVAAGELDYGTTPVTAPFFADKHAPAEPNPGLTALVKNLAGGFQGGQWQAQFLSCTNWLYSLERSPDLQSWTTVTNGLAGNCADVIIADPAPPADKAFYRIRADQP